MIFIFYIFLIAVGFIIGFWSISKILPSKSQNYIQLLGVCVGIVLVSSLYSLEQNSFAKALIPLITLGAMLFAVGSMLMSKAKKHEH